MIIDRSLASFVVLSSDSVVNALQKVSQSKSRFVCCVTEHGILEGVLTDGDFRRWIVSQTDIDLSLPVVDICNRAVLTASIEDPPEQLAAMFSERITFVPLVDAQGRLVAIARPRSAELRIEEFVLAQDRPTFVIAEIGINHNGSLDVARKLIDEAVEAGADCAKFQMRNMAALYRNAGDANDVREDLGSQYTLNVLSKSLLSDEDMLRCFDHCRERGILPLCTPWDLESVKVLEGYGMPAYKVASADLTNHDLLQALAATGKPVIMSTGMSTEEEIRESAGLLRRLGAPFVLLHCNSTYPAPFKDVNLSYMRRLRELGDCLVGYSGHERGYAVPVAAVALGARVVEKHFTLDRGMEGNDHKVSLLPAEFGAMVEAIRAVEESMGSESVRSLSQGERMNRENLAKSLIAKVEISAGTVIKASMLEAKSPGKGLQPNRRSLLVGRAAKRDMVPGDFFYDSDLEDAGIEPRPYSFRRPWGVPVRYHDWRTIYDKAPHQDFLEFHLSFKDMDQDVHQFFDEPLPIDLVVHSPDLFTGDHLLNLADEDEDYRSRSIAELQRVVDLTRDMKRYFTKADRVKIVVSLGGFSKAAPMAHEERAAVYARMADSLSRVNQDGVELLPQTLPPFPWYLGGQLYCNVFVDAADTVQFCRDHGYRVCFDISHSKLTANHRKQSFSEFVDLVAPHTGHLHIVDAAGVDGEGLQVGEGEIDFAHLAEQLDRHSPGISFIPEIWQGHKNDGEGFWIALDRLERWF
jgi:sialic acid synthase SpsE/sugar phosphate isomerase/epimerase